jgi:hypothetical protein
MTAPIFVPLLVATWLVGGAVTAQAATFFLAILEASATPTVHKFSWRGPSFKAWMRDGIEWPEGVFADHAAKAVFFVYLVVLWGVPPVLLGRFVAGGTPWSSVIAGTAFWVMFPIGLLSSLSSPNRWSPFRIGVIVAFVRRPLQTLGFYVLSAPVLAIMVLTFDLVLIRASEDTIVWSLALAPVATVMFFIYARLLGRLGMVVSFAFPDELEEEAEQPRRRKRRGPRHAYDERTRMFGPTEAIPDEPPLQAQPPEMQGIETPYDGVVTGYGVDYSGAAPVEEPKPAPIIQTFDDEDDEPIRVAPPPEISTDRRQVAERLAKSTERELALHAPSRIEEPTNPYGADAVTFLFNPTTVVPWATLTLGLMLMALLQCALHILRPE